MPEIIQRGYVYIGQPPLYKVKKGKQEQYVKDDGALNTYLLQLGMAGAQLYLNPNSTPLSDADFTDLVTRYQTASATISRLERRYPRILLEQFLEMAMLSVQDLQNKEVVSQWLAQLQARFEKTQGQNNIQFRMTI